jgi:hypothetical protein
MVMMILAPAQGMDIIHMISMVGVFCRPNKNERFGHSSDPWKMPRDGCLELTEQKAVSIHYKNKATPATFRLLQNSRAFSCCKRWQQQRKAMLSVLQP